MFDGDGSDRFASGRALGSGRRVCSETLRAQLRASLSRWSTVAPPGFVLQGLGDEILIDDSRRGKSAGVVLADPGDPALSMDVLVAPGRRGPRTLDDGPGMHRTSTNSSGRGGHTGHTKAPPGLEPRTTVMIQRIAPSKHDDHVRAVLIDFGIADRVDAMYVPMNRKRTSSLGYAFVNFTAPEFAKECIEALAGRCLGELTSNRPCRVAYSKMQGLEFLRHAAQANAQESRSRQAAAAGHEGPPLADEAVPPPSAPAAAPRAGRAAWAMPPNTLGAPPPGRRSLVAPPGLNFAYRLEVHSPPREPRPLAEPLWRPGEGYAFAPMIAIGAPVAF